MGDDDILIDIKYASICHSDIHQMKGDWGPQQYPQIPGHEIVGIVAAVGKNVTRFKVGDRAGVGCMVGFDRRWLAEFDASPDHLAGLVPFSGHTITHFTIRAERGIPGEQRRHDRHPQKQRHEHPAEHLAVDDLHGLEAAGYAALALAGPPGTLILLAGLVYLVGCFGVTVVCNVPMNEALGAMDPSEETAFAYWSDTYLPRWTFWNSVRTAACAVSAALLLLGILWLTQTQARTA
mgnify:CR=1 FL=1